VLFSCILELFWAHEAKVSISFLSTATPSKLEQKLENNHVMRQIGFFFEHTTISHPQLPGQLTCWFKTQMRRVIKVSEKKRIIQNVTRNKNIFSAAFECLQLDAVLDESVPMNDSVSSITKGKFSLVEHFL
jgi:hypothetical protein